MKKKNRRYNEPLESKITEPEIQKEIRDLQDKDKIINIDNNKEKSNKEDNKEYENQEDENKEY